MPSSWIKALVGAGVVVILLLFWAIGCGNRPGSGPIKKGNGKTANESDVLASVIDSTQPSRLGITSSARNTADILNQWYASELDNQDLTRPALSAEEQAWFESHIPDDAIREKVLAQLNLEDFNAEDVEHVRDGLLLQSIAQSIAKGRDDDLDRVTAIFDFVTRNIELARPEDLLPLTRYETLMFGRGTPEDRAWIFADLLRQLRYDAAVLTSKDGKAWLAAAVLGGKAYLFDGRAGAAVSTDGQVAATVAQVVADPSILAEFYSQAGIEDGMSAEDLKSPQVKIVGDASLWALRMQFLDQQLTGDMAVPISDPVVGDDGLPARLSRVQALSSAELAVWLHPLSRAVAVSERDTTEFENAWEPLLAPIEIKEVEKKMQAGAATRGLWKTRIRQYQGDLQKTVTNYVGIRSDIYRKMEILGQSDARRTAYEESLYWSGLAQWELNDWETAVNTLDSYIGRYANGIHADQCRMLLAAIHLELGNKDKAKTLLENVPATSPSAAEAKLRLSRFAAGS